MAKKPVKTPNLKGTTIAGKPVTPAQWQSGALGAALARGATRDGTTIRGRPVTQQQWEQGDLARALFPGGLPPGTPGGPPLPPAAAATVAPPDPILLARQETLKRQRDIDLPAISGARQRGLSDYGFNEGAIDPATGYGSLTFDPNNPFSKAALLKQNWDRSRRASAQSMGAGGQLYSGAFQNQQDFVNRGQLGAEDTLQKSLGAFLAANTGQRTQALTDYELGVGEAQGESTARIPTNPLYNPSASQNDVTPKPAVATTPTGNLVTRKSAKHGGALWRYKVGSNGNLIPVSAV